MEAVCGPGNGDSGKFEEGVVQLRIFVGAEIRNHAHNIQVRIKPNRYVLARRSINTVQELDSIRSATTVVRQVQNQGLQPRPFGQHKPRRKVWADLYDRWTT